MMTEYQEMTSEWEEELVSQLTPREQAKYREMKEILPVTSKRDRARNGAEAG